MHTPLFFAAYFFTRVRAAITAYFPLRCRHAEDIFDAAFAALVTPRALRCALMRAAYDVTLKDAPLIIHAERSCGFSQCRLLYHHNVSQRRFFVAVLFFHFDAAFADFYFLRR